ncbi:MAG TPA: MFS transporter [Kineosporiaceae bacterium]|nr:MFS transporter [Kineosporiaceae bacterium]
MSLVQDSPSPCRRRPADGRTPEPGGRRLPPYLPFVAALTLATCLQWLGSSAVLPLLPLYLRRQGTSDAMVGAVMAAFFAAGVVAQYLGGRLGDRIGHRPVLLIGLVGYAVASAGFLLPLAGPGYAVLRAGQGAAAGAAQVAMLALVTGAVPAAVRGRAISAVFGGELAGVAIGPLLGSLLGVSRMATLFLVASGAALLAGLPVLVIRRRPGSGGSASATADPVAADPAVAGTPPAGTSARVRLPRTGPAGRALVGVMLSAVASGVLTGVYEACWTLLLDYRHAQPWQIGASWTLFALPFVLGAPIAGWVADHYDRRLLVVVGLLVSVGFALAYPWIGDVTWLIGLGAAESLGVAFAVPAAQSLLGQAAPADRIGQAQGLFASIQTAAIAGTALVSGALFAVAAWWPFTLAAVVALALTGLLPWVWRGTSGWIGHPDGRAG